MGLERGVPIRAISRGLAVLQAVNRNPPLSMTQISRTAEVPYPTACRIVQTLLTEGLIEREPSRKRYRPTALVKTLASGFHDENQLVSIARPHIIDVTKDVVWPVSLSTRVGARMMVRDSTFALTSLTLNNYYPGYTLPLAECSSGKAYMAFCDDEEREAIMDGLRALDGPAEKMGVLMLQDARALDGVREAGFATQPRNVYTANPGRTSSIAVPIFADGKIHGTLALVFFASALSVDEAAEKFLSRLQEGADAIGRSLAAQPAALPEPD
ncbi:MAG: helix-turn-helix domain-containing protein [Sphingomonadales bacterium]